MTDASSSNSAEEGQVGLLQLFPMRFDVDLTLTQQFVGLLPWGSASAIGLRATSTEPPHTEQILFGYEWPIPYSLVSTSMTKEEKEHLHYSRYCTDWLLATGSLPYQSAQEGANPPDLTCTTANGTMIGLDCTQFTISTRQKANGLFEKMRSAVLREPRQRFAGLRGCVTYMWFKQGEEQGLPFRISDEAAIQEVLAALAEYAVDFRSLMVPGDPLPEQAPEPNLGHTARGCEFYTVPMQNAVPSTLFFSSTGFELGFTYSTRHDREQGRSELARLIEKHDKLGIDHLLITVGGPNERGLCFVSEVTYMEFILEQRLAIEPPKHLSQVTIHLWGTGGIFQIVPQYQIITTGLYPAGLIVASHNAPS